MLNVYIDEDGDDRDDEDYCGGDEDYCGGGDDGCS